MNIKNFIKRQAGIGRLPDDQLNEVTVTRILRDGAPFIVVLPTFDTVKSGGGYSISKSMGNGYRQTIYNQAPSKKVQRKISTIITFNIEQLIIQHAHKNGKHIIIKTNKITKAGKIKNGVIIELNDGIQYQFIMDSNIMNKWKTLGFNPQFTIDIFYKLLTGYYIKEAQKKYNTKDVNEIIKKIEQEKNGEPKKSPSNLNENPMKKIKEAKELLDMDAITQEEYETIKMKYLKQI